MKNLTDARKLIKECLETQNPELDLENCGIADLTKLPELLKCREHLKKLDMSFNQITDISFLKDLTQLQSLDLSNNQITNYSFLKDLKQLQSLYLSGNQISDYSFLKDLKQLQSLSLIFNQITDISFLKDLKQLQALYLSGNQISDISFFKDLKQLQSLNLSNNQIKELPLFIFQLGMEINMEKYGGQGLCLYGNPIESPPLEIVKQGREAVLTYFKQIEKQGRAYIYEAKLILVGQGGAGKTSLQKRLLNEIDPLPKEEERTRGIEIKDFIFDEKKVAHIWDFGGQDVYFPVHRFFITENTVFVLLASTRDNKSHNFEYWIPTIFQFGGKSPIIIGQTCHDGNTEAWNDLGIFLANPEFTIIRTSDKPYYEIDLPNNNKGLNNVKKCIISQIENLPHFREKEGGVPASWATIRQKLLEKNLNQQHVSRLTCLLIYVER